MKEFILTFGQQYHHEPHPTWQYANPDGWVVVEAADYDEARELVVQNFGTAWAFLYFPTEDFGRHFYERGEIGRISNGTLLPQA